MAGLIAIATHVRGRRVGDADLSGLRSSYQALRGAGEDRSLEAADFGRAALLGAGDTESGGVRTQGRSWAAYVGSPYSAGELVGAEPASLDGQFAMISYDAESERLDLVSDPFGLQAIYVAERDGTSYVSTSVLALAKHLRARPDVLGLEVFLRSGMHFGELTNWDGITRLAPATRLSLRPGRGPQTTVYWQAEIEPAVASLGLEAAAHHCVETAVAALRVRFARRRSAWCDLTGGFDTRLMALLLDRAGLSFSTTTSGQPDDPDVVLAAQVAEVAGWPWERARLPARWSEQWRDQLGRALAWGDGQMEVVQLAEVLAVHERRASTARVLFNGGGGEHWRDYAWKQELLAGGRTRKVNFERWVNLRLIHAQDLSPFRRDPTPAVRAHLIERCRTRVAPFEDLLNSTQLDLLYAHKSMGHFGAYQSAARGTICQELPLYARPVFTAAFSVTPGHRAWHRLMRRAIQMLDPRCARLATTAGGPAEPFTAGNALRIVPYLADPPRRIARKLTEYLPGPTLGALASSPSPGVLEARRHVLDDFRRRTGLRPARMRSGSLYDRRGLLELASSATVTTDGWMTLGRIITAELALEAVDSSLD